MMAAMVRGTMSAAASAFGAMIRRRRRRMMTMIVRKRLMMLMMIVMREGVVVTMMMMRAPLPIDARAAAVGARTVVSLALIARDGEEVVAAPAPPPYSDSSVVIVRGGTSSSSSSSHDFLSLFSVFMYIYFLKLLFELFRILIRFFPLSFGLVGLLGAKRSRFPTLCMTASLLLARERSNG